MAPLAQAEEKFQNCGAGFQWYTCQSAGQSYAGCCSVDPCALPGFCPAGSEESGTARTTQSMNIIPMSTSSAANGNNNPFGMTTVYITNGGTTAAAITSVNAAVETPPRGTAPSSGATGGPIPVSAAVGIVVGVLLTGVLAGLCIWGRRKRKKKLGIIKSGKGSQRGSPGSSKGTKSLISRPLPRVIIPRSNASRDSDVFGGGYDGPISPDLDDEYRYPQATQYAPGANGNVVSPLTPGSTYMNRPAWPELESRPARQELDSMPVPYPPSSTVAEAGQRIRDDPRVDSRVGLPPNPAWNKPGYVAPTHTPIQTPIEQPRATLRATDYERRSRLYATSWAFFQSAQI